MSATESLTPPAVGAQDLAPFEDSSDLLGDQAGLRARVERDGYLFFKRLLEPELTLELRRQTLAVLDGFNLRADPADPLSGLLDLDELARVPADELRPDIGLTGEMYFQIQRLAAMHRLPHHPALVGLFETLLGEEVFVHPRHIMRAMTPHPANRPTPPHQDFAFIQGSTRTWTAWFPVGDAPLDLGPLMILRGSHRKGFIPWGDGYEGWMSAGTQLCQNESDWVGGDYEAGDVLAFPCYTVHRGLPPVNRGEIRLSMDIRYQPASDVIEEKSFSNHSERDWDEVYAGWPAEAADLKYYWRRRDFELAGWDESLLQPGIRRVC